MRLLDMTTELNAYLGGTWVVKTAASTHYLDLDAAKVTRISGSNAGELRRDLDGVGLLGVVSCRVGDPMVMMLDVVGDGCIVTMRRTTPVMGIQLIGLPAGARASDATQEGQVDDRWRFTVTARLAGTTWTLNRDAVPRFSGFGDGLEGLTSVMDEVSSEVDAEQGTPAPVFVFEASAFLDGQGWFVTVSGVGDTRARSPVEVAAAARELIAVTLNRNPATIAVDARFQVGGDVR